jgi:hypothetical protein
MGRKGHRQGHGAGEDSDGTAVLVLTDLRQQGESARLVDFYDDLGNPAEFTGLPAAGQERSFCGRNRNSYGAIVLQSRNKSLRVARERDLT